MGQQVCLRWNNFHNSLVSTLEILWDEETFCDVTLACQGQEIRAHKVVLSACSAFFKTLLKNNSCKHPIVILHDMSLCNLEAILQFIYKGQVEIEQEQLKSLLRAASSLQIRGLAGIADQQEKVAEPNKHSLLKTKVKRPLISAAGTLLNHELIKKKKTKKSKGAAEAEDHLKVTPKCKEELLSDDEALNLDMYVNESENPMAISASEDENLGDHPLDPLKETSALPQALSQSLTKSPQAAVTCRNSEYPPFPCPFCSRAYSSWGFRRRHIKAMHALSPTLSCKWCSTSVPSRIEWERHVISEHALSQSEAEQGLTVLKEAHTVLTPASVMVDVVRDGHPNQPRKKE